MRLYAEWWINAEVVEMSFRTHSNIAYMVNRRLPQIYGAGPAFDAISTSDPNTLHGNKPSRADADGLSGKDGVVSFAHDYTASDPAITLWFWSERINKVNASQGWIKASEAASGHTKTVPGLTLCTFTIPENVSFKLQSDTAGIRNCWLGGSRKDPLNPNEDYLDSTPNSA